HIRRISEILGKATQQSLVLFDEMGAGTDPADGAALGRAILDELSAIGSRAIVTTHIGDLKTYALSTPGTENAAVALEAETPQPRYRLHIGDIGQSNALKIARHLKLPEHIIGRAESYRAQQRGGEIPELEILQQLRKEAEEAREGALRAQAGAERTPQAPPRRLAALQDETPQAERAHEAAARLHP